MTGKDNQHEAELATVAELACERLTYRAIASRTGFSLGKVYDLLKENRERWLETQRGNTEEYVSQLLAEAEHVERTAWQDYKRSKEDRTKYKFRTKKMKLKDTPSVDLPDETTSDEEIEGQTGDPRFLAIIQKSHEFRAKLRGLFAPELHEHRHQLVSPPIEIIEYPELPPRELPAEVVDVETTDEGIVYDVPAK